MSIHTLTAVLHKEDDLYVVQCPEVGTVSQGETIEEAVANLREATELYLEEVPLDRRDSATSTVHVILKQADVTADDTIDQL